MFLNYFRGGGRRNDFTKANVLWQNERKEYTGASDTHMRIIPHQNNCFWRDKFYKPLFLSSSLLYLLRGVHIFIYIYFGSDKRHFTTTFKKAVPILTSSNVKSNGAFKSCRKDHIYELNTHERHHNVIAMNAASKFVKMCNKVA